MFRYVWLTLFLTGAVHLPTDALSGPPLSGAYSSQSGELLPGRYTESFLSNGGYLTTGNAINAGSWDGGSTATQWRVSCPELVQSLLLADFINPTTGTGQRIYQKIFAGGTFWLNGTGEAWDGGDAAYAGSIDTYEEVAVHTYVNWQVVDITADITWTGSFNQYSSGTACDLYIQWAMQGVRLGDTVAGPLPPGFPPFVASSACSPTRSFGMWAHQPDVAMVIDRASVTIPRWHG